MDGPKTAVIRPARPALFDRPFFSADLTENVSLMQFEI